MMCSQEFRERGATHRAMSIAGARRLPRGLDHRRPMSTFNLNRREFLASGCSLAGATLLTAAGCTSNDDPVAPSPLSAIRGRGAPAKDDDLAEPRMIASIGGVLAATITASTNPVVVGGRQAAQPVTYDGTFPGPTLWAHPGDTI